MAESNPSQGVNRRKFLFQLAAAGAGAAVLSSKAVSAAEMLKPGALIIDNPLSNYPNRDWEKAYRNLYKYDSTFTFLCAPNDTHNCLLNAYVKNGVVTRIAPTYGYGKATDLDGNRATARWDPRCCQKGLALTRRFYGDRRVKAPMARKGFVDWAREGFPRDPQTGAVDQKYLQRGRDAWVTVTWDEAFDLSAKAMKNIAETYSGHEGEKKLLAQGFDPAMVEATHEAGIQTIKIRGGMPALGITRVFGLYRLSNVMALLDAKVRGVDKDKAVGARDWDSYTWHTDLPPGHPQVTGQQTLEWDLCNVEHANLILVWGMNWITTKMPDGHWLTEARMKGTKIVVIAAEYSATANKADELVIVRPGTTPALALGFAQVMIEENLFDADYVKRYTDLPMLVRNDDGTLLRASDVIAGYKLGELKAATVLKTGEKDIPNIAQTNTIIPEKMREDWGDYVVWDAKAKKPVAITRDQVGKGLPASLDPQLDAEVTVTLADGKTVKCQTVFRATKQMLDQSYTPEDVEKLTWAPAAAVRSVARQIGANKDKTLFAMGMGPNQFFNNDLKDRAVFLVAALTRNVGKIGGNVGSYAGNYRGAYFNGLGQYIAEDPFDIETDPAKPAKVKKYYKAESAHYFDSGDRIQRMGKEILTGKTHMPTPTKAIVVSNSNSLIGNAKGHYEMVVNTFKRVEFVSVLEWWWTASCEYADVVFPVDSWAEFKYPDMTMSVTNPFLYVFPVTPLKRIHNTKPDVEVIAGLSHAFGKLTGDSRFDTYWKFVQEGGIRPYIQRILNASSAVRGNQIADLEAKAEKGIPAIIETRTYPKIGGWEQANEDRPWYTRTGRLEFYRDEPEFRDSGENMVVHREPIDSTFYEPNAIVSKAHPLLRPKGPEAYGVSLADVSTDTRQARHVIRSVDELLGTYHPLIKDGYRFVFHTPKYRHGAHTTPVDTDIVAIWFGPFGDMYRADKRKPFITEMFVDINPVDAKSLGVEDGDYVYIDADPSDRPFRGWQKDPKSYEIARLMARARYYAGTPRGITRMWHNVYCATPGSVAGAKTNPTGIAKNPATNYQALYRTGSQQSATRGWLKPTWQTDSLYVKDLMGQKMVQGFVVDVNCATGAPRESFVKITLAEPGGEGGQGLWRPASLGLRPTYENAALKRFFGGQYVKTV